MNDKVRPWKGFKNLSGYFIPSPIDVEKTTLDDGLNIFVLRVFELDLKTQGKRYIRSFAILIENSLITSNVRETENLLSELLLFEKGDKNNEFFDIVTKNSVISLKLKLKDIYISKAKAKAIVEYFNKLNRNYNMSYAYEDEIELTLEGYNYFLFYDQNYLKRYTDEDEIKRFKMYCQE